MPTAAKLVAAICFLALGYVIAEQVKLHLPAGMGHGYFNYICAAIGLVCGWLVMGVLAGQGYWLAIGSGIRTSATMVFFGLLFFSGREMIVRSLHHNYRTPVEALEGMFGLFGEYALLLAHRDMLAILILGGVAAAWLVEWAARRWN